uniref:PLA2c domain-containing protein n=2 Tax=Anolis carolinensis TaxID=28377 RepID=A0A803T3L4_ANOCA
MPKACGGLHTILGAHFAHYILNLVNKLLTTFPESDSFLSLSFLHFSLGPPEQLISNGVLAARELSILDIRVNREGNEKLLEANTNIVLTVQESYEETQKTSKDKDSFRFHCIKSWDPVLKVKLQYVSDDDDDCLYPFVLPLKRLPVGLPIRICLLAENNVPLDLHLQVTGWPQNLDVRLGYELCVDEQDFLKKRKKVVAGALKNLFHLRRDLLEHEVPVVAIMATGGGLRAMTALYAHLLALQKLNLLDCVSYISTASGSTWTLTDLYRNVDWSHKDLEEPIKKIKKQMMKSKENIISIEQLKYYHKELKERVEMGHLSSFTALWSLVQEAVLHDEPNYCKLSEQREALNDGQNPFPIYTAINVKECHVTTFDFREWVEFNPYEVGFQKYGAYIRTEDFDSEFFMGKIVKRIPESRICYLEGIWTNIFSRNLLDSLYWSSTPAEFWQRWVANMAEKRLAVDGKPSGPGNCHLASRQSFGQSLEKLLLWIKHYNNSSDGYATVYKPPSSATGKLSEIFNDILTDRPLKGATHNFLRSLDLEQDYLQQKEFNEWRDTVLDASPSQLTLRDKSLCLIDIGYFLNNSGPPLLKPERNVDVIIALDYEISSPFKQAEMMAKYCEVQGIPFPKVHLSDEEKKNLKECYAFSDEENPKAPIVVCFPLVDCSFKEFKAPGVKRSSSEKSDGEVNLQKGSPYATMHLTYTEEDCDKLINLSTYNILCNKDCIFKALLGAIEKKQGIWPSS